MNTFFTADLHFNDTEIIELCNRPFKNIHKMNMSLIRNINSRCKPEDQLIIVGDIAINRKDNKHYLSFQEIKDLIYCNVVPIMGNHDKNNGINSKIYSSTIVIANRKFLICHIPPLSFDNPKKNIYNFYDMLPYVDGVICGHVHNAWKTKKIKLENGKIIPIINVGVDVLNYKPIKASELYNIYLKELRKHFLLK
jgi:calcineurin-like phosphoesterase family protein